MIENNNVFACSAKQARKLLKHGAEAWLATAKIEPQTTQALKHEVLQCPHCRKHHVNQKRWSTFNHHRHLCLHCEKHFLSAEKCVGIDPAATAAVAAAACSERPPDNHTSRRNDVPAKFATADLQTLAERVQTIATTCDEFVDNEIDCTMPPKRI